MKLNCIAIDDEKYALDLLADNINRVPYLNLVASCKNTTEAAAAISKYQVHLIFSDIQMPGMNGLQFIENMSPKPLIIFITAFDNYALKAFNADAIDYLVKPVAFDRFLQATNKALLFYSGNSNTINKQAYESPFIFVSVEYNLVKITITEILYIEALKDYVKIYFIRQKKPILTRSSLKSILELLPSDRFLRIHKSFIIAVHSIFTIKKDSVILDDSLTELPLGDGYKNSLHQLLKK